MSISRTKSWRRWVFRYLRLMGVLLVTACEQCEDPASTVACAGVVTLEPATVNLQVGQSATLQATWNRKVGANCPPVLDPPFEWTNGYAPSTEIIGSTSTVRIIGVKPGTDFIRAELRGAKGSSGLPFLDLTEVIVVDGPPATLTIAAPSTTVVVGSRLQLTGLVRNAFGGVLVLPDLVWSSSAPGLATVTQRGEVTGVAPGGPVVITVMTSSGEPLRASVQLVVVTSLPVPVDRVEVTPPEASISVGETLQLAAAVRDASGNILSGRTIAWSSTAPAVATVSSSGLVSGVTAGAARIFAIVEAKSAWSTIVVTPAPTTQARYAYALADNPTTASYTVSNTNGFTSSGQPITITRTSVGVYQVQFAGMQPAAAQSQSFQITTIGTNRVTCKIHQVSSSATGITATVHCYTSSDAAADQSFAILLLGSFALPGRFAFGWAHQPNSEDPYNAASAFSSNGQTIGVTRDDNGVYSVGLPGLGRSPGGMPEVALVTATGNSGSRCTLSSFLIDESLHVHCVGGGQNAFVDDDAAFMVVLLERGQPGRRFGFATITGAAAVTADEFFSSSGGAITATRIFNGRTDVTFAGLGRTTANGTETIQLGPRGDTGSFCKLLGWQTIGADLRASVQCYDLGGAAEDREFRIVLIQ